MMPISHFVILGCIFLILTIIATVLLQLRATVKSAELHAADAANYAEEAWSLMRDLKVDEAAILKEAVSGIPEMDADEFDEEFGAPGTEHHEHHEVVGTRKPGEHTRNAI